MARRFIGSLGAISHRPEDLQITHNSGVAEWDKNAQGLGPELFLVQPFGQWFILIVADSRKPCKQYELRKWLHKEFNYSHLLIIV